MPQTILAVLGLMITIVFSLSTQREVIKTQRHMITNELEVMATGVALEAMEKIRTRAFDAVVASDPDQVYTTYDFSYPIGTGNNCQVFGGSQVCNDLDDFNQMEQATIDFDMGTGDGMPFNVQVDVRYVDENLTPVSYATYWKEVTVKVQDVRNGDAVPFIRTPIQLSRVYAYNFGANKQGHGGRSEGHDQGDGQEWFETFIEWFMDKMESRQFRDWAEYMAHQQGWHDLAEVIDGVGRRMNPREARDVQNWFGDHPDTRDEVVDWWYEYIYDGDR